MHILIVTDNSWAYSILINTGMIGYKQLAEVLTSTVSLLHVFLFKSLHHCVQGCYACTPTIKVPDNREVRDNKRRDFRCSKSAMHEPDVGPGERSLRLPARSR